MAGRKKKRRPARKKPGAAVNLGRIAIVLAAAAVVILAAMKYIESPRGRIILLDLGFDRYYSEAQSHIEELIKKGAPEGGIPTGSLKLSTGEAGGEPGPVTVVRGDLPPGRSLLRLNIEIDGAVRSGGGRVRSCVEKKNGRVIEMEIGTRRSVTHRCVFRMGRKKPDEARPSGPSIAIIIDDFGYSMGRRVKELLALEIPVTVSVIPGLKYSEKVCRQAREAGKEVICHLPMEPENGADDYGEIPLVSTGMRGKDIENIVEKALESTPGVIGMNNHMGSKATADMKVMESVMKVCRRKKLFFVDSYTSSKSVVAEAAKKRGVATLRNDLFLDNRGEDVRENMRKILSIASRSGRVTAIMHVKKESAEHLRWLAEEAEREGVRIIRLSDMMGS